MKKSLTAIILGGVVLGASTLATPVSISSPALEIRGIKVLGYPIEKYLSLIMGEAVLSEPENLTPIEREIVSAVSQGYSFDVNGTIVSPQEWNQIYYNILVKYSDDFSDWKTDPQNAEYDLYKRLQNKLQ